MTLYTNYVTSSDLHIMKIRLCRLRMSRPPQSQLPILMTVQIDWRWGHGYNPASLKRQLLGSFQTCLSFYSPPGGKPRGTYAAVENQTLLIRETGHFWANPNFWNSCLSSHTSLDLPLPSHYLMSGSCKPSISSYQSYR